MAITRGGKAKAKLRELGYEYGSHSYDPWRLTNEAQDAKWNEKREEEKRIASNAEFAAERATAGLVLDAFGLRSKYEKAARKVNKRGEREGKYVTAESLFLSDLRVTTDALAQAESVLRLEEAIGGEV